MTPVREIKSLVTPMFILREAMAIANSCGHVIPNEPACLAFTVRIAVKGLVISEERTVDDFSEEIVRPGVESARVEEIGVGDLVSHSSGWDKGIDGKVFKIPSDKDYCLRICLYRPLNGKGH